MAPAHSVHRQRRAGTGLAAYVGRLTTEVAARNNVFAVTLGGEMSPTRRTSNQKADVEPGATEAIATANGAGALLFVFLAMHFADTIRVNNVPRLPCPRSLWRCLPAC